MEEKYHNALSKLFGEMNEEIFRAYEAKILKAIETVESKSVKKYLFMPSMRTVWIVVGKEREYLVIPRLYCQCDDFYINVVIRRKSMACYHLIAQCLAEEVGSFERYELKDSDFIRLSKEWKWETL